MKKHIFSEKKISSESFRTDINTHIHTNHIAGERKRPHTHTHMSPEPQAKSISFKSNIYFPSKLLCLFFYKDTVLCLYAPECCQQHWNFPLWPFKGPGGVVPALPEQRLSILCFCSATKDNFALEHQFSIHKNHTHTHKIYLSLGYL